MVFNTEDHYGCQTGRSRVANSTVRYRKGLRRKLSARKVYSLWKSIWHATQPYFFDIYNDCSVSRIWLVSKSLSLLINMSSTVKCIFWLIWFKRSPLSQQVILFVHWVYAKTIFFRETNQFSVGLWKFLLPLTRFYTPFIFLHSRLSENVLFSSSALLH